MSKYALGIIQLRFNCFVASLFKALGIHFSSEQGCGVGGKMSDTDLSKISDSLHNMKDVWLLTIL